MDDIYTTKGAKASVMLRITYLLPSLPVELWEGVNAPDRVLSIGQIELFDI